MRAHLGPVEKNSAKILGPSNRMIGPGYLVPCDYLWVTR
jgi:hypothetical protein